MALDPSYLKGHVRLAKARCETGEFELAASGLARAHRAGGGAELLAEHQRVMHLSQALEAGKAHLEAGRHDEAGAAFARLLAETAASPVVLWAARAELASGKTDRALRLSLQVIRADKNNPGAYVVRGQACAFDGDFDTAVKLVKEALKLDPDNKEATAAFRQIRSIKKLSEAAASDASTRDFEGAVAGYTRAIAVCALPPHAPVTASLHAARGTAHLRLKAYEAALHDCARAIYAQDDCVAAWLSRASALHALGRHDECLEDMTRLMQTWGQQESRIRHAYVEKALLLLLRLPLLLRNPPCEVTHSLTTRPTSLRYEKADHESRKAKRPDYYAMMGVRTVASEKEIKSAYRQRALEWHPDKHVDKPPKQQQEAEATFKAMGDALETLTDPERRRLYDAGHDKKGIDDRIEAGKRAQREHKGGCCGGGGCH